MQLPFELDRPLVFFDLETTGLDMKNDRIIELAFIKVTPHGDVLERERRFNPGIPIPPEATAGHGITDGDVADAVPFCRTASNLVALLDPAFAHEVIHETFAVRREHLGARRKELLIEHVLPAREVFAELHEPR